MENLLSLQIFSKNSNLEVSGNTSPYALSDLTMPVTEILVKGVFNALTVLNP